MKKLALAVVVSAALTFGSNVFAQQPAPLAAAGGPAAGGPPAGVPAAGGPAAGGPLAGPRLLPGGPAPREQGLRPVTTVQGKVVKLIANDDFTFNGFYLLNGSDSLLVKFPAHMGSQVMPLAKTGSNISVAGVVENPPFGSNELKMVTLTSGGKTLTESSPNVPTAPAQETTLTGSGKISALQTNREGIVTGIFTDDKTLLRFPPHIGSQLGNMVAKGNTISFSGSQKNKAEGEVQLENYKIIHCNTLTVNGQQYLVK